MPRNLATHKLSDSSKALTRLPHLARPLLRFNLSKELQQLRNEDSWQRDTGRSSKTLAKYPDFHIVLVLMKANTQMNGVFKLLRFSPVSFHQANRTLHFSEFRKVSQLKM